ncbi:MAG: methyltransferase domain-containing protein [Candidatus Pacebacteria bacterium]|nr:methyltransferase domain-containing protein [Candidatus Paceibacterota bacterium]
MHFADPTANILQMGLREGMKIADLGAGSGHYALAAANIAGKSGRVYAVDVQEDVLKHIRDKAKDRGLTNIDTVWGNIEKPGGTKLKDASIDAVILSNTLFQCEIKEAVVTEIKRILKPGGRVLVVDWAGAYGGLGPHPDHVVPEDVAQKMFIDAGFHKQKAFSGGPHHYSLLFTTAP